MPVWRQERAGAQTGWLVNEWERCVPRLAIRSKLGVRSSGLPWAPVVSHRCWSVKKTTTLGLSVWDAATLPRYLYFMPVLAMPWMK